MQGSRLSDPCHRRTWKLRAATLGEGPRQGSAVDPKLWPAIGLANTSAHGGLLNSKAGSSRQSLKKSSTPIRPPRSGPLGQTIAKFTIHSQTPHVGRGPCPAAGPPAGSLFGLPHPYRLARAQPILSPMPRRACTICQPPDLARARSSAITDWSMKCSQEIPTRIANAHTRYELCLRFADTVVKWFI